MTRILRDYRWQKPQDEFAMDSPAAPEMQANVQAYDEGYSEGYLAGKEQALSEFRKKHEAIEIRLRECLSSIHQSSQKQLENQANQAAEMLAAILPQFFIQQAMTRENIEHAINQVIKEANAKQPFTIYISEEDHRLLQRNLIHLSLPETLRLEASPNVQLGGCLLEGPQGILDGRLETQIEKLKTVLLSYKQRVAYEHDG